MRFEWDPQKAERNLKRRRISFAEASTVFYDPLAKTIADPDHSATEHRELTIGQSHTGRLLIVKPTQRQDRIRIISARLPTRRERRQYEEDES
jgi:uncharacterized DUF497 family protein